MNSLIDSKNKVAILNKKLVDTINSAVGERYSVLNNVLSVNISGYSPRMRMGKNDVPYYCSDKNTFFPVDITAMCLLEKEIRDIFSDFRSQVFLHDLQLPMSELENFMYSYIGESFKLGFTFKANDFCNQKTSSHHPFACQELNFYSDALSDYDNLVRCNAMVEISNILNFIMSVTSENSQFMIYLQTTISKNHSMSIITSQFLEKAQVFLTTFIDKIHELVSIANEDSDEIFLLTNQ